MADTPFNVPTADAQAAQNQAYTYVDRRARFDSTIPVPWLITAVLYVVTSSFVFGGLWMQTQTRLTQIETTQAENRIARQNEETQIQDLTHTLDVLREDTNNETKDIGQIRAQIEKNSDMLENALHGSDFPAHRTGQN